MASKVKQNLDGLKNTSGSARLSQGLNHLEKLNATVKEGNKTVLLDN